MKRKTMIDDIPFDSLQDTASPATPTTCPHTETQIAELTKTVALLSKTMSTFAKSQEEVLRRLDRHQAQITELFNINSRLKDRINAIEGLGIPR